MKNLERAALYESIQGLIEEIDATLEEYGFDPAEFDEDAIESGEVEDKELATLFTHINGLRAVVE